MIVSIVVSTFNRLKTLPRTLLSVLEQTYQDIEVIVVDDGSTDGTDEYMRTVTDPRVRYVKLETNQGASIARNRGIQEAQGEYILVWDSDDVLYPNALENTLDIFKKYPEYSIVSAPAHVFRGLASRGSEAKPQEVAFPKFPQGEVTLADILIKKIPSNEKVRVARTTVMKQVSYKARSIDFLVNVELIERGKWFHVEEYLADVFNDSTQESLTALRKKRNAQHSIERAPHIVRFLEKHGEYLKKISPTRYADHCYGAAVGLLLAKDAYRARHYAHEAVENRPNLFIYRALALLSSTLGGANILRMFY